MSTMLKSLVIGAGALVLCACSASPHYESAGEYLDSSTTTTKVKASLIDGLGATGLTVKVKTYKDEVQLSGFVDTPLIKQRAGAIAAGVEGVQSVRNDIIVKTR